MGGVNLDGVGKPLERRVGHGVAVGFLVDEVAPPADYLTEDNHREAQVRHLNESYAVIGRFLLLYRDDYERAEACSYQSAVNREPGESSLEPDDFLERPMRVGVGDNVEDDVVKPRAHYRARNTTNGYVENEV